MAGVHPHRDPQGDSDAASRRYHDLHILGVTAVLNLRVFRLPAGFCLIAILVGWPTASASRASSPSASAQAVRVEHRVVVPTTERDNEADVEASLERNVNRLAAVGFSMAAFVGGNAAVTDALLVRRPYVAGQVDHAGQVFAIMTRPMGRSAPPREYRLLHTRTPRGLEPILTDLGQQGYRMTVTAHDGAVFHAAFERVVGGEPVEYRVFMNRGRTSWMAQVEQDAPVLARLSRVVPIALDAAIVQLVAPSSAPGALEWFSAPANMFASEDDRLQARANEGYRVQLVRVRNSTIDVLLVRPAGPSVVQPTYSLEEGPWGAPCGRGRIVGADVFTDGDVYCVTDASARSVENRGFEIPIRTEGDRTLFDVPACEDRARLGSSRIVEGRLVAAAQLERALNDKVTPGYRVTRILAGIDGRGDHALSVFTSLLPSADDRAGSSPPAPLLRADRDELLEASSAALEEELTSALRSAPSLSDAAVWVEVGGAGGSRQVRLAGCASTRLDRDEAERMLRSLLPRTAAAGARLRNDVIVDRWR